MIQDHIDRAVRLLGNCTSEHEFRYACLEARTALELSCYRKFQGYLKEMPITNAEKWKPKEVIQAMLEIDPDAEEDFDLAIIAEDKNGNPIKPLHTWSHKAIKWKWANKTHNALSSYLHAPSIAQQEKRQPINFEKEIIKLKQVIEELKSVDNNDISSCLLGLRYSFICAECGEKISRLVNSIKKGIGIRCINSSCGAIYDVDKITDADKNANEFKFSLRQLKYECLTCKTTSYFATHKVKENTILICPSCDSRFVIKKHWMIQPCP